MVKDKDFTEETLQQFTYLTTNKQTAFDLLVENYRADDEMSVTSAEVVSRLQTEYVALDRNENYLKTKKQWAQSEFYEPAQVNTAIPEITKGKYSSFAIRTVNDTFDLSFPLDDDYASFVPPFSLEKDIPDITLETNLQMIKGKYGVKMGAENQYETSVYKGDVFAGTVTKIVNLFLSMSKKPINVYGKYNGTISIRSKIQGYTICNVEKLIWVYDLIFKKAIKQTVKNYTKRHNEKVTKQTMFGARLFADILMSRVLDLKDVSNNRVLEKCLWLQFSNALNKYGYSAKELKQITEIGANLVADTCRDLDISKDKIIERMKKLGYDYSCSPRDEFQALINAKQKDYSIYDEAYVTMNIASNSNPSGVDESADEQQTQTDSTVTGADTSADASTGTSGVNFDKTKIKPSTIKNIINKAVDKAIKEQVLVYNNKLGKKNIGEDELKEATTRRDILVHIWQYYNESEKTTTYRKSDTDEVRIAKSIARHLVEERERLVAYVSNGNVQKPENQRADAFINQLFKQDKGVAVKKYYSQLLAKVIEQGVAYLKQTSNISILDMEYYVDEVFNKTSCLQLGVNYKLLPAPANLPAFVEVDDGTKNSSPTDYMPNFVILDGDSRNQ